MVILFLLVFFKEGIDKKLKFLLILFMYIILLPPKHEDESDLNKGVKIYSRSEFVSHEFINIWDNIQTSVTNMSCTFYSVL